MDVERQKMKLASILKEIDLLSRYDKRNAYIRQKLEQGIYVKRLIAAGKLLDQAGILETYDNDKVLQLLTEHKDSIIKAQEV